MKRRFPTKEQTTKADVEMIKRMLKQQQQQLDAIQQAIKELLDYLKKDNA